MKLPDLAAVRGDEVAFRSCAADRDPRQPFAQLGLVFHPRCHLLADIAPFFEIHTI